MSACELCAPAQEDVLVDAESYRVILVDDADFPGFCRVILRAHVREMSDLEAGARAELMEAVFAVERAMRRVLAPTKVNLASLGNVVPHVHWHVIPRYEDDPCFPAPIWAPKVRGQSGRALGAHDRYALGTAVREEMRAIERGG